MNLRRDPSKRRAQAGPEVCITQVPRGVYLLVLRAQFAISQIPLGIFIVCVAFIGMRRTGDSWAYTCYLEPQYIDIIDFPYPSV